MKKTTKPQAQKGRNVPMMKAMQEKRFGNASGPHKSATDYRRKPKHVKRGWDD